jgi:hypothetical protein
VDYQDVIIKTLLPKSLQLKYRWDSTWLVTAMLPFSSRGNNYFRGRGVFWNDFADWRHRSEKNTPIPELCNKAVWQRPLERKAYLPATAISSSQAWPQCFRPCAFGFARLCRKALANRQAQGECWEGLRGGRGFGWRELRRAGLFSFEIYAM